MKKAIVIVLALFLITGVCAEKKQFVTQGFMEKSFGSGLNIKETKAALELWLNTVLAETVGKFQVSVSM